MVHRSLVLGLLGSFVLMAMLDSAHFPFSDGAEHGAAVRELANNFINPDDPMIEGNHGGSARYVPSVLIMAAFLRLSGLDVLIVIKIFSILFLLLFVFSVDRFARRYFDVPNGPFCLLMALLFLWGTGWTGANAYMFSAMADTAYFPSVVSFSFALLALSFLMDYLQGGRKLGFVCCCILGGITFVNHPLTGAFFFTVVFFLLLERSGSFKRCFGLFVLIVAAALSLSLIWPYYQFFESFAVISSGAMAQTGDYQMTWQYLHSDRLLRMGPALFAVPLIVVLMFKRKNLMVTGSFVVFVLVYVVGYFSKSNLSERFIFFIVFTLQLAFSLFWVSCRSGSCGTKKGFCSATVCLAACLQLYLIFGELIVPAFSVQREGSFISEYSSPNKALKDLRKYLNDDDIVISDIYSSWALPVYTGAKIIALWHTPPHIKDNFGRTEDVKRFFNPETCKSEQKKILAKYSATHILLNHNIFGKSNELIESRIARLGYPLVLKNKEYSIFAIQNIP